MCPVVQNLKRILPKILSQHSRPIVLSPARLHLLLYYRVCRKKGDAWSGNGGFSPIVIVAGVSVLILAGAIVWRLGVFSGADTAPTTEAPTISAQKSPPYVAGAENDSTSPISLSNIGGDTLQKLSEAAAKQDVTSFDAQRAASDIAESIRAEVVYDSVSESDIRSDVDTSFERVLVYRDELRRALTPLLSNRESEISIFARYIESGDKKYLAQLKEYAGNLKKSAVEAQGIVVPADAVPAHAATVNAMLHFSATLEQMTNYANDPLSTLALIRTYNRAEEEIFSSFGALAEYQKNKIP